jgi:histidine kinase
MSRWRTLRVRLLASYLAVVLSGALTLAAVASVTAPTFFAGHMADMDPGSGMMAGLAEDLDTAFAVSMTRALAVGVLVSVAVALVVSALVAGRIIRPLDRVRTATRRLAEGSYSERVALPAELELAGLASDVNALASSLEETEQKRLQLIADLSHELRTPLTAIEGYMEGLIDGVVPAEAETFASVAEEAARLKRLASDLSSLSRMDEQGGLARRVEVDLGELVASVAMRLRPQFDDQNVALRVDSHSLRVSGDPDRLTQVIVNLLGNALSYTPSGGTVEVTGRRRNGHIELAVGDTGRGLSTADLQRVFERFYRADPSSIGGSGIGLTIARGIARAHGGDVVAHSDGPGAGATFTLVLPAD